VAAARPTQSDVKKRTSRRDERKREELSGRTRRRSSFHKNRSRSSHHISPASAATTACSVQIRSWPSLPIFVGWFLQATDRWRHMVSKLHGGSMPHRCLCSFSSSYCIFLSDSTRFISPPMRSSKFVTSRLYAIYLAADEIFKMHDISALRDLYRRR
jgi:hypothetical protein